MSIGMVFNFVPQPAKRFLEEALDHTGDVVRIPAGTIIYHARPWYSGPHDWFAGPFYGSNPLIATFGSKLTSMGSRSRLQQHEKFRRGAALHCVAFKNTVRLANPLPVELDPAGETPHLAKYRHQDHYPGTELDTEAFELMFHINGDTEFGTWVGKPPQAVSECIVQTVLRIDNILIDLHQFRAHPHIVTTVIKWILASKENTVSWFEPSVDDCNALAVAMCEVNPKYLHDCIILEANYFENASYAPEVRINGSTTTLFLHESVLRNPELANGVPELKRLVELCPRLALPQWFLSPIDGSKPIDLSLFKPYADDAMQTHPRFITAGPQLAYLVETASANNLRDIFRAGYENSIRYDFRGTELKAETVRKLVREVWGVEEMLQTPILPKKSSERAKWDAAYSQWEHDVCNLAGEVPALLHNNIEPRFWMSDRADVLEQFILHYKELNPTKEAWQALLECKLESDADDNSDTEDTAETKRWLHWEYLLSAIAAKELPPDLLQNVLFWTNQNTNLELELKKELRKSKRKAPEKAKFIEEAIKLIKKQVASTAGVADAFSHLAFPKSTNSDLDDLERRALGAALNSSASGGGAANRLASNLNAKNGILHFVV